MMRVILVVLALTACSSKHSSSPPDGGTPPPPDGGTPPGMGKDYQICTDPQAQSTYLKSPWTYHDLASGSQTYTAAEYKALNGYGTTLPPLPDYFDEASAETAAIIFAPGASVSMAAYNFPGSPVLYFFEAGAYGSLGLQSVPGDLFIGGSAPGFPLPTFTGGGISAANDHFDFSGGGSTLATAAAAGATTITTKSAIGGYISAISFADGTSYDISSNSGTTIHLGSALSAAEPVGTAVWADVVPALGKISAAGAQGATTFQTGALNVPLLPWENVALGTAGGGLQSLQVASVTGSAASGYTVTLTQPLAQAVSAKAPVFYDHTSGSVTVEYLDISGGAGDTTFWAGSGWTIAHNNIHDNYAGGAAYSTTNASGTAIIDADNSLITYNCFQRLGEYALNGGGTKTQFNYNQVDSTPYNPDLSGNGQTGCGKWWASTNNDVIGNAFTNEGRSVCVWFDNGNTGMLIQNNYFYNIGDRAIQNETGFNSSFIGNDFEEVEAAIYLNDSGGWDIPGSRFNNQIVIQGNTFNNAMTGISIWGASGRSCLNSGEGMPYGESAAYCSGGFPQMGNSPQYFSHYYDSIVGELARVAVDKTCSATSPCSTVTLSSNVAVNDWIGFTDRSSTTTSDNVDVSTFAGSGMIHVASTVGFPTSGQLLLSTSDGTLPDATGAVVSYTGTTATSFTGVKLVFGSGRDSGAVQGVQPYHVTAVSCPGGNCNGNTVVTVSPAITVGVTSGALVYATGTCPYYLTVTATPSAPLAPDGSSYYDGCMWENRNISVTGNVFSVDAMAFNATTTPEGGSPWNCTLGPTGNCAQNAMGYQYPGGNALPYNDVTLSNAMMSAASLPAPFTNLNASGSPTATGSGGDVGPNASKPYNNVWSGNTYNGAWTFQAYTQAADCPLHWNGSALSWVNNGGNACSGLSVAQWTSIWHQN